MPTVLNQIKKSDLKEKLLVTTLITVQSVVLMILIAIPLQNKMTKIPLIWGTYITLITCILITIWAWLRPRSFIFSNAPTNKSWRDLRIWTTVFMVMQIFVYWILR